MPVAEVYLLVDGVGGLPGMRRPSIPTSGDPGVLSRVDIPPVKLEVDDDGYAIETTHIVFKIPGVSPFVQALKFGHATYRKSILRGISVEVNRRPLQVMFFPEPSVALPGTDAWVTVPKGRCIAGLIHRMKEEKHDAEG